MTTSFADSLTFPAASAGAGLRVVRLCSVFEPPAARLDERGARFDPIGGMQNHCAQLTRALDRLGVEQTVITHHPPGAPRVHPFGAHATVRRHGLPVPWARQLYAAPAAADLVRRAAGADLVHVHLGEDLAVIPAGLLAARVNGLPLVVTIHCSLRHTFAPGGDVRSALLRRLGGRFEALGVRDAAATIVLTRRLAARLTEDGADPGRVHVIPSGVRPQEFRRPCADPWPRTGGRRVVFVGRLHRQKGVRTLVEAARHLRTPGAQVHLVGDGPERHAVEAGIRRHGLGDRVRLLGFRPHDEVPAILAHADVLVLPSVYEELGSVLLEAMQAGVPIVATSTGGIPDAVGPAAELVPPCDPVALAAAVDRVLGDPTRAAELAALARERARRYDWSRLATRVLQVYRSCTGLTAADAAPGVWTSAAPAAVAEAAG
jgi:glycogen synthase